MGNYILIPKDELYHYGVKGMHWGVRRYQNYDGSLIKKEPLDILEVQKRSGMSYDDSVKSGKLAEEKFKEAFKKEPKITRDISRVAKINGSKMHGLEHRLKQPTSMAGKIGSDSKKKKISIEDAANGIKDALRYTIIADDNKFVRNYNAVRTDLRARGYREIKCRNYFKAYERGEVKHKSVQSVFEDRNGYLFEIQFQTPSSQKAKDLKTPLYEEARKADLSPSKRKKIEMEMDLLAKNVKNPRYIGTIRDKG